MSNEKILVVDDEPFNLEILEEVLNENYNNILFAKDGFDCLEKIDDFDPDLVLLDVSMPLMNGYECCKKIKANPRYDNLPVIFISARGNSEERLMGYSAGGADYIVKPFDEKELLLKVERTLTYVKNAKTLASELDATKNIALESMTANSELGQVMQFCEKLFSIQTFDSLLITTLEFFCNYGLNTIGLLVKEGNKYCATLEAACTPLEMDLINLLISKGRIFSYQNRTQFNFKHISLLVKNMPLDDEAKLGRLKDLIPVCLTAVDACYERLIDTMAINEDRKKLEQVINNISLTAQSTEKRLTSSQIKIDDSITDLKEYFFEQMVFLDLTHDQEIGLKELLESSSEKIIEQVNDMILIKDEFNEISIQISSLLKN